MKRVDPRSVGRVALQGVDPKGISVGCRSEVDLFSVAIQSAPIQSRARGDLPKVSTQRDDLFGVSMKGGRRPKVEGQRPECLSRVSLQSVSPGCRSKVGPLRGVDPKEGPSPVRPNVLATKHPHDNRAIWLSQRCARPSLGWLGFSSWAPQHAPWRNIARPHNPVQWGLRHDQPPCRRCFSPHMRSRAMARRSAPSRLRGRAPGSPCAPPNGRPAVQTRPFGVRTHIHAHIHACIHAFVHTHTRTDINMLCVWLKPQNCSLLRLADSARTPSRHPWRLHLKSATALRFLHALAALTAGLSLRAGESETECLGFGCPEEDEGYDDMSTLRSFGSGQGCTGEKRRLPKCVLLWSAFSRRPASHHWATIGVSSVAYSVRILGRTLTSERAKAASTFASAGCEGAHKEKRRHMFIHTRTHICAPTHTHIPHACARVCTCMGA